MFQRILMNFVNEAALFDVVGKCLWGKIKSIESFDGYVHTMYITYQVVTYKQELLHTKNFY